MRGSRNQLPIPVARLITAMVFIGREACCICCIASSLGGNSSDGRIPAVQAVGEDTIRKRLRAVPEAPGCYLLRDAAGKVIYVGKALRLRSRLRSYFQAPQGQKLELMKRIHDFEVMRTANDVEALVLENELIKHYQPRFNIRLKDDKNFLYLKLPMREDYPRVHYTRRIHNDGAIYFGPFASALGLRQTVKSIRQLLPFRTCSDDVFRQGRVCLDFHIKRCPGPCEGRISREDYRARVQEVAMLMEGRSDVLARDLHGRMEQSAEKLDFENAARYRDKLRAVEKIADRQKVVTRGRDDQDLVSYARQGKDVFVEVAYIRGGKMVGHDGHALEGELDVPEAELLRSFLVRYYSSATHIPRTIVLTAAVDEEEQVRQWLEQRREGPVALEVPQRGRKRQLVDQLAETAAEELKQLRIQWDYDRSRTEPMLQALAYALDLDAPPHRIECYDISNIQGESATGAMVVFEEGRPKHEDYRSFRIRYTPGPNDFAMMQEVLRRRFARLESAQRREDSAEVADRSFSTRPDMVLIDGGKSRASGWPRSGRRSSHPTPPTRSSRSTTRRGCSWSSASATRRTASPSPTTARSAARRR
ncbi:MAG: excinuclease ABC subunit UvrC [Chloroflexi bacterium]|nr:MAG: excinuclease ABC subunit UvrC [Chloroflexota bacterium]